MPLFALFFLLIAPPVSAHEGSPDIVVYMTDSGFAPESIEVALGTHVIFKNKSNRTFWPASNLHPTHSIYPHSGIEKCGTAEAERIFDACREVASGESYGFVFDEVGTWQYHDHVSGTMNGTVTVRGASGDPESSTQVTRMSFVSFISDLSARLHGLFLTLCSSCKTKVIERFEILPVLRDDAALRYWMRVLGPNLMMDALVKNATIVDFKGEMRQECHVAAHILGKVAFQVYGPELLNEPIDYRCQNGFFHGAISLYLAELSGDDFTEALDKFCRKSSSVSERAQCDHALGHGLAVYYNYDLPQALDECDRLGTDNSIKRCYHGVFMENIFTIFNASIRLHTSVWVHPERKDNFPCDIEIISSDEDRTALCYNMQPFSWARPITETKFDTVAAARGCHALSGEVQRMCYQGIGFAMSIYPSIQGDARIVGACEAMGDTRLQEECIAGALMTRDVHWGLDYEKEKHALCSVYAPTSVKDCGERMDRTLSWVFEP